MLKPTLLLAATLAFVPAVSADEAADAAKLEAAGAKIKKDKSGAVLELSAGSTAKLTLDDFRLIGRFKQLRKVWLSPAEPTMNDEALAALGAMETVENFFSNGATISDDGLKAFAGFKSLRHLGFDHWGWKGREGAKGMVGAGLSHLAALPNLESIRLGGCRVDNQAAAALAQVKTLQKIDLFHTSAVTDDGVASLTALPKLRVIILAPQYSPRITDASLEHLSKIPTIEEIEIGETWLTYDKGFVHLKKSAGLKAVRLKNVIASDEDIARLKSDHPNAKIEWTKPDETVTAKTKAAFERHREKMKKDGK